MTAVAIERGDGLAELLVMMMEMARRYNPLIGIGREQ